MFTEEEIKKMAARSKERNRFRHVGIAGSDDLLCPVTNKTTKWALTSHDKPGEANICEHCCPDDYESRSLSELNAAYERLVFNSRGEK